MRLLLTIFLAFSIPENDCSTFYLIRHAEKVRINKTDGDPALNEKGMIRALNWRDFFIDKDIFFLSVTTATSLKLLDKNSVSL